MAKADSQLEVVSIDVYSGGRFVVYFSDETYVAMTTQALAECFPDRTPVRPDKTKPLL